MGFIKRLQNMFIKSTNAEELEGKDMEKLLLSRKRFLIWNKNLKRSRKKNRSFLIKRKFWTGLNANSKTRLTVLKMAVRKKSQSYLANYKRYKATFRSTCHIYAVIANGKH